MPEFPEVYTTVMGLRRHLLGARIRDAWIGWPRLLQGMARDGFRRAVRRRTILRIRQRGKYILLELGPRGDSRGILLTVHLRMTGRFLVGRWRRVNAGWSGAPLGRHRKSAFPHLRLVLFLQGGRMLALSDVRKFARLSVGRPEDAPRGGLSRLGPEALGSALTPARFARLLHGRRGTLKPALLDQRFISGLGNIYSDEALWRARLHPRRAAASLSRAESVRLFRAIRKTIRNAIRLRGSSLRDWRDVEGRPGRYLASRTAYGRRGEPCMRCGAAISRIRIGGRSSFFCPRCQRLPRRSL